MQEQANPTPQTNTRPDGLYPNLPGFRPDTNVPVGGTILRKDEINYNCHRHKVKIKVRNTGDRPIQIGSHFHFFEVNRYLRFDRSVSLGYHLNIPATTAMRFEPGEEKEVELVRFGGKERVIGFNNLTDGYSGEEMSPSFYPIRSRALRRAHKYGFLSESEKCRKEN